MLEGVGSTTWHNRHLAVFRELNALLMREGPPNPVVMIVGPGGVTTLAKPFLNDPESTSAGPVRKLIGDMARYGDQLLRRFPALPLVSLEPLELHRTLSMPHELIVIDRQPRVLDGVRRVVPEARCYCIDIESAPIPELADAVIAFNIICRLTNPRAGLEHLVQAVRPGGWLLMDDRSASAHLAIQSGFTNVAPKIHRKA